MQNRQIIRVTKHTDNCQKLGEGGRGSACLVGSGFLCEEMKCSDLDSSDRCSDRGDEAGIGDTEKGKGKHNTLLN